MRRILNFACEGDQLAATLDEGGAATGLLIVSGGNEIRIGAHRGMAELAAQVAAAGHPVLRFDRRGIGDSEGVNTGFRGSGPDLAAALAALRAECPDVTCVIAFGNCDAATALALHGTPVAARILANPWVIPSSGTIPPAAAIKARYSQRLRDPEAWRALLSGRIDLPKLAKGLGRLVAAKPPAPDSLADKTVRALEASPIPTTILLATGDATAIAFADVWRNDPAIPVIRIETPSHSFSDAQSAARLTEILLDALR
ncbi:MAG: hydrolase 1, exosortase A system-associated [Sphingomonadaceae bacterium]